MTGMMVNGDEATIWALLMGVGVVVIGAVFVWRWRSEIHFEPRERGKLLPDAPTDSPLAQRASARQVEEDLTFRQMILDEYGEDPRRL